VAALPADRVTAGRLRRRHLDGRAAVGELVDVAARLGVLHAQLMSSAELIAWARVEALPPGELADRLAGLLGGRLELAWSTP
jgi:hypothetical protein